MTTLTEHARPATGPHPCAARPHANLVHLDGPCRCFVGGPAPEHASYRADDPLVRAAQRTA